MTTALVGPIASSTVRSRNTVGKYPVRERVTVTQALSDELDCTQAMAHKRLYEAPTIRHLAMAVARSYRAAGADGELQKFLHDIQAAGRGPAPKLSMAAVLASGSADRKDDGDREAFVAMQTRETFLAWRADTYRTIALQLGLIEAGNTEYNA